jgi:hypothetical protein
MLAIPGLIYLHIPKAAGIFVRQILREHFRVDLKPGPDGLIQHEGVDAIPDGYRDRTRLATVRNPWSWYVSWFHYGLTDSGRAGINLAPFADDPEHPTFHGTLQRMLDPAGTGVDMDAWTVVFPGSKGYLRDMAERGVGLATYYAQHVLCSGDDRTKLGVDVILDSGAIREHLLDALLLAGIEVDDSLRARVRTDLDLRVRANPSKHVSWPMLYSRDMQIAVAKRDLWLIRLMGYRADGQPPGRKILSDLR